MPEPTQTRSRLLASLPPEWPRDLLPELSPRIQASGRKIVVLDDDPTGTQTVHGIPVLTTWTGEAIGEALESDGSAFYILTNSRSLAAPEAEAINRCIGERLRRHSEDAGVALELVSRSDSTLRGHFPREVTALLDGFGAGSLPCLLVPFFFEGGRLTVGDTHYVGEGDRLIPAAQTAYAEDAAFGYRHSNLRRWVEEKTGGQIPMERVASVSIETIRKGGPPAVAEILSGLEPGGYCVVNAASYRDLEVVVAGLLDAEDGGSRFIFRTAASFVRVRAGIRPRGLVDAGELTAPTESGGLFVVGSYVPKTTDQLSALLSQTAVSAVEIEVERLLDDDTAALEIARATAALRRVMARSEDAVLFTSRRLVAGNNANQSLDIGRRVSQALISVLRRLAVQPRYLVAKGGITSSDVATKGLDVRKAMVMGQVLPGVPVWKLGPEARFPGMAYIVFPGNVGETDALVRIHRRLSRRNPSSAVGD
jgi:uncharacterized protein YgbK (DUF1537 family)